MDLKLKNASGVEQTYSGVTTLQVTKTDGTIGYFDERIPTPPVSGVHLNDNYLKTINDVDSDIIQNATTLRFTKDNSYISGATKIETESLGNDGDIFAYKNDTDLIIYSENNIKGFNSVDMETYTIKTPIAYVEISDPETMAGDFLLLSSLQSIYLDNFYTSELTNMSFMFADISKVMGGESTYSNISFGNNFDTSNVTNMESMFAYSHNLTTINGLENFNTSNVTKMDSMFIECLSLTTLDLSSFNMNSVVNTQLMFAGNSQSGLGQSMALSTIYVSEENSDWTQYNITQTFEMFNGCENLPNWSGGSSFLKAKLSTDGGYFTLKV